MSDRSFEPFGCKAGRGSFGTLAVLVVVGVALGACTGNRFGASSLPPAPVGSVTGQALPPPGSTAQQPGVYTPPGTFSQQTQGQYAGQQFPTTQQGAQTAGQQTATGIQQGAQGQVVAGQSQETNSLESFSAPATALAAAEPGQLSGAWTISDSSGSCQLFLTNTTWTGGLRASTRGCGSTELQKVSAWNTSGKEIVLKDLDSKEIARLARTAPTQYQGVLSSGSGVAFFR